MLAQRLIHPPLLAALAAAGHGSTVLLADANYPHSTGARAGAPIVHLNFRPGQIAADDVLSVLIETIPVEAANVMQPEGGADPAIFTAFRALLPAVELQPLSRAAFYAAARGPDLAVVIATGDQRLFANLLLTVGVVAPDTAGKESS